MADWLDGLPADPLPWLLDASAPAVRHLALRQLLDRPGDDPDVLDARDAAMRTDPIASILAAMDPAGWWVKPGHGYLPKYTSTVWQLVFLDQLGADGTDPRIQTACAYLLDHAQTANGGFGAVTSGAGRPPPSAAIHCLNGNLLRALIGFGWLDDERVGRSIDWQAAAITGEGEIRFYRSSLPGPGFRCGANEGLPCAWGATKAVLALARIPAARRAPHVQRALDAGVAFLLSRDPASGGLPDGLRQHEAERVVVQARLPVRVRVGRPAGPGGGLRGGSGRRSTDRPRDRVDPRPAGRAGDAGRTATPTPAR